MRLPGYFKLRDDKADEGRKNKGKNYHRDEFRKKPMAGFRKFPFLRAGRARGL